MPKITIDASNSDLEDETSTRGGPRATANSTGSINRKSRYTGTAARRTTKKSAHSGSGSSIFHGSIFNEEWTRSIKTVLLSPKFDCLICFVIVLNSISIGMEISADLKGEDTSAYKQLENLFLIIYVGELASRFSVYGLSCLTNPWVAFDFVLVVAGVMTAWIIMPLSGSVPAGMGPLMVLRIMRLFRLARAVRLLVQFKTLWMLVCGLLYSLGTIFYTFLLMLLIIYVWACLGIELITKHDLGPQGAEPDPDFEDAVETYFSSLPQAMFTLMRFVILDSASEVYDPIVAGDKTLLFYFLMFMAVVSIALMNLVTAVIVEGAIEQAEADKEMQKAHEEQQRKLLVRECQDLFEQIDADASGFLSKEEIETAPLDAQEKLIKLFKDAGTWKDVMDQMEMTMDLDRDGFISIKEFIDGIMRITFGKSPPEMLSIHKHVTTMHSLMKKAKLNMQEVNCLSSMQVGSSEGIVKPYRRLEEPRDTFHEPVEEEEPPAVAKTGEVAADNLRKIDEKPIPPKAQELLYLRHKVNALLAQVQGSLEKARLKVQGAFEKDFDMVYIAEKERYASADVVNEGFEYGPTSPSQPSTSSEFYASAWVGSSKPTKRGEVGGDLDNEPPAHEDSMTGVNLSFQELLAENAWLRNQLTERALQLEEKQDTLKSRDKEIENVFTTVLDQLGDIFFGDSVMLDVDKHDKHGSRPNGAPSKVFGGSRQAATKPMKVVAGDTTPGSNPSSSRRESGTHDTQLALYQPSKTNERGRTKGKGQSPQPVRDLMQEPPELSQERLADLVGFTMRTATGATVAWKTRGGGSIPPNACTKELLLKYLEDVNPDLLRFARDSPGDDK